MLETAYETFVNAPVGGYAVTGSSFVWCLSPELCGAFLWGQQPEDETRRILNIFDHYRDHMAPKFGILLDTRGVEKVDYDCLKILFEWLVARRKELMTRIHLQANVIREGPIGFLLTGLLPVVGPMHPYNVHTDPIEAFTSLAGEAGIALCAEVEAIAERVRGVPHELTQLRMMLRRNTETTLDAVSRALRTAPRSLQRLLTRHSTSFHREVTTARFERAMDLLRSSDQKLAAVSAHVGISERSLTLLFRARTGLSPSEWRKRQG